MIFEPQGRSMRRLLSFIAAVFIVAGLITPAAADDRDTCAKAAGDEAIAACSRAIASGKFRDKALAPLFNNRGYDYKAKGDYDRAIADYNEAIRLDSKNASAFNNRGTCYYAKGDHDRAISDYSEAIRLDPGDTVAFANRGLAYEWKGDREHAKADFDAALAMAPKYDDANLRRIERGSDWRR
jgi:tetratricopeptide (TPR) repeat protein